MKKPLTVGSLLQRSSEQSRVQSRTDTYDKQDKYNVMEKNPERCLPSTGKPKTPASDRIITFQHGDAVFSVEATKAGDSLLNSALAQEQWIDYKCRQGTCRRCSVQILSGTRWLSSPNQTERERLAEGIGQGYRLACQAVIKQ